MVDETRRKTEDRTSGAKTLGRVGTIGRFKPLHKGAYVLLDELCRQADEVMIGIGSSNKYNLRNPFTAQETEEMLREALSDFSNYTIVHVPDFAQLPEYSDGRKWKEYVIEKFGKLDCFFTTNDFVKDLLDDTYKIVPSYLAVPESKRARLRGTEVRVALATFGDWKSLVPDKVAQYMEKNGLDKRFRKEFGLQTLAELSHGLDYRKHEDGEEEKAHAREA